MEQRNDYGDFIGKKQFIISMVIIVAVTVVLFLMSFLLINNRITVLHENKQGEQQPVFNETDNSVLAEDEYVIKEFEGKIGVYKNGDFQYLINVYVFTLPENDKKLLSQGITVSSEQELNDILSSYY